MACTRARHGYINQQQPTTTNKNQHQPTFAIYGLHTGSAWLPNALYGEGEVSSPLKSQYNLNGQGTKKSSHQASMHALALGKESWPILRLQFNPQAQDNVANADNVENVASKKHQRSGKIDNPLRATSPSYQ